jgi:hypothetical protein
MIKYYRYIDENGTYLVTSDSEMPEPFLEITKTEFLTTYSNILGMGTQVQDWLFPESIQEAPQ